MHFMFCHNINKKREDILKKYREISWYIRDSYIDKEERKKPTHHEKKIQKHNENP